MRAFPLLLLPLLLLLTSAFAADTLSSSSSSTGSHGCPACPECNSTKPEPVPQSHGSEKSTAAIVGEVALLTLVPTVSMTIGSVVVSFYRPGGKLRSGMQHFAAGVVLAAVSMELLPIIVNKDVDDVGKHVALFAGFLTGVFFLLGLGRLISKAEGDGEGEVPGGVGEPAGAGHYELDEAKSGEPASATEAGTGHEQKSQPAVGLIRQSSDPTGAASGTGTRSRTNSPYMNAREPVMTPHRLILKEAIRSEAVLSLTAATAASASSGVTASSAAASASSELLPGGPTSSGYDEMSAGHVPLMVVLRRIPLGLVAAVATDGGQDGMLIGISYVAGAEAGVIMTIALGIEMCFLGISTAVVLAGRRVPRRHVLVIMCILPWFIMLGGVLGASILAQLHGAAFYFVLAFGTAALLYLVADELLVEAHKDPENDTIFVTLQFFFGFIFVLLLQHVDA